MLSYVALSLLGLAAAYAIHTYRCFTVNLTAAKQSGIPYFCTYCRVSNGTCHTREPGDMQLSLHLLIWELRTHRHPRLHLQSILADHAPPLAAFHQGTALIMDQPMD